MSTTDSHTRFVSPHHDGLNRIARSRQLDFPGFHFHRTTAGRFKHLVFEHTHARHTLFVVFTGSTSRSLGVTEGAPPQEHPDHCGAVSFVPAGRRHRSILENGSFVSGYLGVDPAVVEAACGQSLAAWTPVFNARCGQLFAELSLLNKIAARPHEVPKATMEGLQLSVARSMARAFAGFRGRTDDARLPPSALCRVLDMMDKQLASDLSLAEMACEAGLSISAFARAFRGSLGVTPGQYVQRQRMVQARELLQRTDAPSSTIATRLGFADAAHFANAFRRTQGCSPRAFRRTRGP